MMRNYRKTIGALAAASALVAGYASAEVEGEIHIGGHSDYIFRGADLGEGLAEAGADISSEWNGLTLSGGVWYGSIENSDIGNLPIGPGVTIPDHYSELDLYAEVAKDLGFLNVYVGYIWYHYQDASIGFGPVNLKLIDDSQEIYFGVSRELGWGINGALTYYWDVEGDNGGYTELALDKTFAVHECVDLVAGVKTGYLVEEGGFSHVTPQLTANIKVSDTVTVSPYLAYSVEGCKLADHYGNNKVQALFGAPPSESNHFYGGVRLSVKF
jgi:hypothetical protein